jgi:dihydrofolate reductase
MVSTWNGVFMGKVTANMSMSLDGFIAGPNVSVKNPLGDGGERLHEWMFPPKANHQEVAAEMFKNVGAVIMGRQMFNTGEEPWGDNPPFHMPVFVLTHEPREKLVKEGGTTFTFVADGIESALKKARAVAGEKDVLVAGGANAHQQYLKAGLLDEIEIHLIPVLFGQGVRLFDHSNDNHLELESIRVIESPGVTHLRFGIVK